MPTDLEKIEKLEKELEDLKEERRRAILMDLQTAQIVKNWLESKK